jgi:hypothetical protein
VSTSTRVRAAAPRRANPARKAPFALVIVGLIVGGMVALLGLNTASAANEVDRSALAEKDQSVTAQLVDLQNQAAASAAPGNLARAAAALGMVPAGVPGFLEIGADGAVRLLGHAQRATGVAIAPPAPTSVAPRPTPTTTPAASPTPTATTTATPTSTATPSATSTATPTAARTGRHAHRRAAAGAPATTATPSPTPTPTDLPTPVITLPGGDR